MNPPHPTAPRTSLETLYSHFLTVEARVSLDRTLPRRLNEQMIGGQQLVMPKELLIERYVHLNQSIKQLINQSINCFWFVCKYFYWLKLTSLIGSIRDFYNDLVLRKYQTMPFRT